MRCRKLTFKMAFLPSVIAVVLLIIAIIIGVIHTFLVNRYTWIILPVAFLELFAVLWAQRILCYIIEFYDDKLIFKTIFGKTIKEVAKNEIKVIRYHQDGMPVYRYWVRFYVFELSHDKKYPVSPFQLEVTEKNEKLLKEHFPDLEIPPFNYFEPR